MIMTMMMITTMNDDYNDYGDNDDNGKNNDEDDVEPTWNIQRAVVGEK